MAIPSFAGLLDYVLDRVDLDCDLATSPSWREILAFRQAFVSSLSSGTASSSSRSALAADLYLHDLLASFQALVGPTSTAPEPTLATTTTRRQRQANAHTPRGSQQDAMEFLTHLLDHLHEQSLWVDVPLSSTATASDHHEKSTLLAIDDDEEYAVESEDESEATGWQTVRRNVPKDLRGYRVTVDSESLERHVLRSPPSPIATLFHGCLRYVLLLTILPICFSLFSSLTAFRCRSEVIYRSRRVCSVTFQRFHSLTLHLPASMPGSSSSGASLHLVDLLRNQFQREVLDEGETQKIVQLERLPAVLTLQIARFSFDFIHLQPVKVACPVIYPPTLDLSEHLCFLSPRLAQSVAKGREGKAVYRLQAVVLHHGKKATGGHYSTYLAHHSERGDAIWHHLNDSKCAPLTESQALAAESLVYLLFYTRDPQQSSSSTS